MISRRAVGLVSGLVYTFLLAPILVVIVASFNSGAFLTFPPQGVSLRWYGAFLHNEVFIRAFLTSVEVASLATAISGGVGTMAALYTARARPKVADGVRIAMMLPMLLPEVLTAIGLLFYFYALKIGTHFGLALIAGHILLTLPFVYLNVSSALSEFDWSLNLAARSLGASPMTAFFRITVPVIKTGLVGGCIFAFIVSFDAFSTSFLLKDIGTATLPLQLFDYLRLNFTPEAAAVSSATVFITVLIIAVADRLFGLKISRF